LPLLIIAKNATGWYNKSMPKLQVGVLRGGPSQLYDASLKTGAVILRAMPEPYQAHDIFVSKNGIWHREGFERTPDRALSGVDVVFNAMHGEFGEDGKVQKILDTLGVPYTGSDAVASALAMNKNLAKKAFETYGIKTPYYTVVKNTDIVDEKLHYIFEHFLLPLVVKPASSGGSVGITVVSNFNTLEDALLNAFRISDAVLVEEYIKGPTTSVGVLNNFRGEPTYSLLPYPGTFSDFEKQEMQRDGQTCPRLAWLAPLFAYRFYRPSAPWCLCD
jgi:D-alanine-D-alanine ligase